MPGIGYDWPMRFPVSRRSVLIVGAAGAGLGLLSGCGLRLDTPPDVPRLDASEALRNRIARILAQTTVSDGDPDTAGEDLQAFRAAIGPEWAPPTELATEAPPTEQPRTFIEAAEAVSSAVFDVVADLGSGLIPVLTDVATGCALTAGTVRGQIRDGADSRIRAAFVDADDDATAPPTEAADGSEESASPPAGAKEWNTILDQARAAAYGYERLAVRFDRKSRERQSAVARLESLGSLAGEMLENLGEKAANPDAPAWTLDPTPTDARSAGQLALNLEDAVTAALLPWLRTEPRAALRLWESARAREVFAAPQPLRYSYADGPQTAGAQTAGAQTAGAQTAGAQSAGAGT